MNNTGALRAHTPRTPCICIIVQLEHILWTTFTYTYEASAHEQKVCIVGMVNGCGYNSQLKYTICEAYRLYHSILTILRPVFRQLRQIRCTFKSLRCLNPKIWQFFCGRQQHNQLLYPLRMRAG